jgi:hypothetical protein
MVFHKEKDKPTYEVGILAPEISPDHEFSVDALVSKDRNHLPDGASWSLSITGSSPPTDVRPINVGHGGKRRPDDENGQSDFDWIIDLESSEFHGTPLTLKPGLLKPIIHLPPGTLYTQFKSVDLKRWQGSDEKQSSDFGFVPEIIALRFELHKGQELVLNDDTKGKEIFRLPYIAPPLNPGYVVKINNVRHTPVKDSDFRLYYALFDGIGPELKYDFKENTDSGHPSPKNPLPPIGDKTCCMLLCTEIFLGKRTEALK